MQLMGLFGTFPVLGRQQGIRIAFDQPAMGVLKQKPLKCFLHNLGRQFVFKMGNQAINGEGYSEFPIERYLNRGLSRQEVIGVRKIFDKLEPQQERVKVENMREAFVHSFQRQYLENKVGTKQELTYDEFFVIFSQNMNQKKRLYKDNVTFQSDGQVVECLFCPYAVDTKRD